VNGYCEQDDGNFCRPFHVTKLGDSGIFIGSFPNDETDILHLKNQGVSAVLNLQTLYNLKSFGIDWKNNLKLFYVNGIVVAKNVPVNDSSEDTYCQDIFQAAQYLNDMINNKNLRVFIYDQSGVSRSPSVVMAYLTLFKKVQFWNYVPLVESILLSHYPECCPNTLMVQ